MIGSIYKIIHIDSNITYIGSTAGTVNDRWYQHKKAYKKWLNNKEKNSCIAIYPYFEQYSIDRFKMILIKSYDVVDKKHLYVYEQLAINRTKCVNTNAAMQLVGDKCMSKHYREQNRDKRKEYYQVNKQSISEQQKQYKEANKQSISTRKKHYYQANREQKKQYYQDNREQKKQYYQVNREKISKQKSVQVTCECGAQVRRDSLKKHKKSAKHLTLLAAQTN